jgi:hypothetical protein
MRTLHGAIFAAIATVLAIAAVPANAQPLSSVAWLALQTPRDPASEPLQSDDEGARALERLLVTRGGLVLPKYSLEIEPEASYAHDGSSGQRTNRDTVSSALALRMGLPFDSQAELRVPYVIHDETSDSTISGLGDLQLSLTKELIRERDRVPSLLAMVRWQAPTGQNDFAPGRLATGSGFNVVDAQLTVVKRLEPLVFLGAASYAVILPEHHRGVLIEPGDVFGVKLGGILAVSPDMSVGVALNVAHSQRAKVAHRTVSGSDQLIGTIELSVAQILTKRLLLNVTTEIGVTDDARDLRVVVSLPIRF